MRKEVEIIDGVEVSADAKKKTPKPESVARNDRRAKQSPSHIKSVIEPTDDEAKELLMARGIRHSRVIDVLVKLAKIAARHNRIPLNAHLFTHGLQNTLAVREGKEMTPTVEDVWYPGERIRLHELQAIWDLSMSWRTQPDGRNISFDESRQLRRMCMVDNLGFGNKVLGKDFHPEPHGRWAEELFVKKNPDLLTEKYSWEDVKKALAEQSEIHQRLLISSRSSYKSSFNLVDLLSWVLCFGGDLRIMCLSATKPLSRGFLKAFRDYWTMKVSEPTLFNQLFPEYMLWPDELGSATNFISPMRRLDLIQPTFFSTSLDSEGLAGERCDLFVAEDIAEISNSSTPEQREKTLVKFDMLCELLEPFGFLQLVGTPISSGSGQGDDPGDIYSTLLAREAQREEKRMLYQINPCWTVKPGVNKEPWDKSLTADEITLLFPSRLTFSVLKAKLDDNEKVFRQQNLCSWVPDGDEGPKIHFEEDKLRAASYPAASAPKDGFVVLTGDLALTSQRYSDYSALAAIRIAPAANGKWQMVVLDVDFGRWKSTEIAHHIVMFRKKHLEARSFYLERISGTELLQREVNMLALRYQISLAGTVWAAPQNEKDAKMNRILGLQILLEDDDRLLRFVNGDFIDEMFKQFTGVTGVKENKGRKIDIVDAISMAQRFLPSAPPDEKRQRDREKEQEQENLRQHYQRMFGNDVPYVKSPEPQPELEQKSKTDPRLAQLAKCLPPGMRI